MTRSRSDALNFTKAVSISCRTIPAGFVDVVLHLYTACENVGKEKQIKKTFENDDKNKTSNSNLFCKKGVILYIESFL